uniref:Uncharacterized protein n=1 Tax=Vespula pensylvanica TaxID=30213 RepID=A0A834NIG3_VESPE|nr:hypothetical protein H0235_013234 [Vespula pensylvanica]
MIEEGHESRNTSVWDGTYPQYSLVCQRASKVGCGNPGCAEVVEQEVSGVVTKKVEGSAEAVSLDYRGQSSWNPRGADDQTEDAWSPTDHEPSRWGLLIRTNATLY